MNLFPKNKTPYLIWAPPYTHTSSGVRHLHLLCHALNEVGEKAYIAPSSYTGFVSNPALNTPLLPIHYQNFYESNFIAVYSDVVRGNPFNAKYVVRMLLAPRGAYGGDTVFPDTNQIWGALPSIAENVLRLPVSDPDIFSLPWPCYKGEIVNRNGTCFYSYKYEMHGNQKLMDTTSSSTRLIGSLEQLSTILRGSERCYLYELTSVITEAALCGCPVTLIRTPYFNTIDKDCMMGDVQWSDGEIVKECDNYLSEYRNIVDDFPGQLNNFIKKTQELTCVRT